MKHYSITFYEIKENQSSSAFCTTVCLPLSFKMFLEQSFAKVEVCSVSF